MKFERVVQITDMHLSADPEARILGGDPRIALDAVLDNIMSLKVAPSILVATGDLTQDGSVASYRSLAEKLKRLDIPVYVIPGNHDDLENLKTSLLSESVQMVETLELVNDNWLICLLNSKVEDEIYGRVSDAGLSLLEKQLRHIGNKSSLVALHHSPTPDCATSICQLQNADELLALLGKYPNTKVVISGHTHCQSTKERQGISILTTPSTFLHVAHNKFDEAKDYEDYMNYHTFDSSKWGFRVIDLFPDGEFKSEVHWVQPSTN